MNKGFFSVAIIVFIFIISIFFFTLNSQKEIYFSDSYRQMIFDSERAYVKINNIISVSGCNLNSLDLPKKIGVCEISINENIILDCELEEYFKNFKFNCIDKTRYDSDGNPESGYIYELIEVI
jgi:hypothetical protein